MPKLDHIALEVSNLDRAIEFYTEKKGSLVPRGL